MQPGKINQVIAFVFHVADAQSLLIGIVWYLVVVAAGRSNQSQLVIRSFVKRQGSERAKARTQIVQHFGTSGFEAEVGAIPGNTAVVGEALGVVADTELLLSAVKAAIVGDQ